MPEATTSILNIEAVKSAYLQYYPYKYILNSGFLEPEAIAEINQDFPDIRITGFHPIQSLSLQGAFKELICQIDDGALVTALSEKFGMDLAAYPKLVTVRKLSALHEGRIHRDSESKILTMLIYLNEGWEPKSGRLRILRNAYDINNYAAEISPQAGTIFAFLRADNSWHGHHPFAGERRVIQITWVRSLKDIERKKQRHVLSTWLKTRLHS